MIWFFGVQSHAHIFGAGMRSEVENPSFDIAKSAHTERERDTPCVCLYACFVHKSD